MVFLWVRWHPASCRDQPWDARVKPETRERAHTSVQLAVARARCRWWTSSISWTSCSQLTCAAPCPPQTWLVRVAGNDVDWRNVQALPKSGGTASGLASPHHCVRAIMGGCLLLSRVLFVHFCEHSALWCCVHAASQKPDLPHAGATIWLAIYCMYLQIELPDILLGQALNIQSTC
jgi:hypothetical protein